MRTVKENELGRVDSTRILDAMAITKASWMESGAFVLFTGKDLTIRGANWCFGAARQTTQVTVQSVVRYRDLSSSRKAACIARTLRHEVGHLYGCAANPARSNTVRMLGMHCTNDGCSMRQTMSLSELLLAAASEHETKCLCKQCQADAERFRRTWSDSEVFVPTMRRRKRSI